MDAIVCGGAGFGGTTGNITVNSFVACSTPVKIRNEAFQASVIYQFWNPQANGASGGPVAPLLAFAQATPGYTWTGFYAGAHAGWGWSHQNWSVNGLPEGAFSGDGWLAGAQIGYNHQINQWVYGIELDGSFTDIVGQRPSLRSAPGTQPDVIKVEVEGLITLAGRLGVAWNNALFYGKGGAAFARNHLQYTDNAAGNARGWTLGWMVGAGAEYGIVPSMSFKVEYNYMDFGTGHYNFADCNSCPTADPFTVDLKQNIHVVKAGFNYRFWSPGPVVARY